MSISRNQLPKFGKSPFIASSRVDIFKAIKYLLENKLIDQSKKFIDLGSGAGDVTTITAFVFNLSTIGIEYNKKLISYSEKIKFELEKKLGQANLKYIQGDYTNPRYYQNNDVGILYNYLSGDISTILEIVPEGTLFLSYIAGGDSDLMDKKNMYRFLHRLNSRGILDFSKKVKFIETLKNKFEKWKMVCTIPNTKIHLYHKY